MSSVTKCYKISEDISGTQKFLLPVLLILVKIPLEPGIFLNLKFLRF